MLRKHDKKFSGFFQPLLAVSGSELPARSAVSSTGFLVAWQCGLFDMSRMETTVQTPWYRVQFYNHLMYAPRKDKNSELLSFYCSMF